MRTLSKCLGDTLVLGESRYRLKRVGRAEWLTDRADLTDDPEEATDFESALAASWFLVHHVDEPALWHWEAIWTADV